MPIPEVVGPKMIPLFIKKAYVFLVSDARTFLYILLYYDLDLSIKMPIIEEEQFR